MISTSDWCDILVISIDISSMYHKCTIHQLVSQYLTKICTSSVHNNGKLKKYREYSLEEKHEAEELVLDTAKTEDLTERWKINESTSLQSMSSYATTRSPDKR